MHLFFRRMDRHMQQVSGIYSLEWRTIRSRKDTIQQKNEHLQQNIKLGLEFPNGK